MLFFYSPQKRVAQTARPTKARQFPLKQITTKQTFLQVGIIQRKVTCYGYSTSIIGSASCRATRVMSPWGPADAGDAAAETKPTGLGLSNRTCPLLYTRTFFSLGHSILPLCALCRTAKHDISDTHLKS